MSRIKIETHKDSLAKQDGTSYYVYEHYADGTLFYVGKGYEWRWKDSENRNKEWTKIAEAADVVEAKRVAWREREADALNMERQVYLSYIQEGIDTLTNAVTPPGSTQPIVKEVKIRDEEEVTRLLAEVEKWKSRSNTHLEARNNCLKTKRQLKKHREFLLDELIEAKEQDPFKPLPFE